MDEKRGKQKRRDRVSKAKTHSSKTKVALHYIWHFCVTTHSLVFQIYTCTCTCACVQHTKSGGDILAQIKAKENIVRSLLPSTGSCAMCTCAVQNIMASTVGCP